MVKKKPNKAQLSKAGTDLASNGTPKKKKKKAASILGRG